MSNHEKPLSPQNLVTLIQNNRICLENISNQVINAIKEIGAFQGEIAGELVWLINYVGDKELATKLHELSKLGFLFVGEPAGWPPVEVFNYIREKKLLVDTFKEITWRGPGDWVVRER